MHRLGQGLQCGLQLGSSVHMEASFPFNTVPHAHAQHARLTPPPHVVRGAQGKLISGEELCTALERMTNVYLDKYFNSTRSGSPHIGTGTKMQTVRGVVRGQMQCALACMQARPSLAVSIGGTWQDAPWHPVPRRVHGHATMRSGVCVAPAAHALRHVRVRPGHAGVHACMHGHGQWLRAEGCGALCRMCRRSCMQAKILSTDEYDAMISRLYTPKERATGDATAKLELVSLK